jgi:hypothetical protein
MGSRGHRRITRQVKKGKTPGDMEELRCCYKIMGNTLLCVKQKHQTISYLQEFALDIYASLAEYLGGDTVAKYVVENHANAVRIGLSFFATSKPSGKRQPSSSGRRTLD